MIHHCIECPLLAEIEPSGFGLLRYLDRIVDFDSKVSDGALELGVAEQ